MNILNFAHPLTPKQIEQITSIVGTAPDAITDIRIQLDLEAAFQSQIVAIVDGLNLTPEQWQTGGWLVALPSLNYAAAVLLAELHGRMGHFPAMLRLRPVAGALVTEYDVAEIVNLEAVRAAARTRR
jgi:hypothetical protein